MSSVFPCLVFYHSIKVSPIFIYSINRIGGVMDSVLVSSAVDRVFEPQLGQTKDYKIDICCFSAEHAAIRRKSKDWLAQNQDNVSDWCDISIHGLLFQWASTINIQLSMSVQNKANLIISLNINLFSPWNSSKIAHLALNNNHSITLYSMSNVGQTMIKWFTSWDPIKKSK